MIKNIAHSVQARLLNLSKAKGVPYQHIVTRYFQERLLYRLSHSKFRDNFILKGGALLYAHNEEAARPTLDLDFMGARISREKENLLNVFREVYCIEDSDGVDFREETLTTEDIAGEKKYPGVRLGILAALGTIHQVVSMDIGFGDVIVPEPVNLDYPTLLDNNSEIRLMAYSIETVIAEKLQTMVDRYLNNSRMKDFFDVWMLLSGGVEVGSLKEAIISTFANRNTDVARIEDLFLDIFRKDIAMNTRWYAFVKKLKRELPDFSQIMSEIERGLSSSRLKE